MENIKQYHLKDIKMDEDMKQNFDLTGMVFLIFFGTAILVIIMISFVIKMTSTKQSLPQESGISQKIGLLSYSVFN